MRSGLFHIQICSARQRPSRPVFTPFARRFSASILLSALFLFSTGNATPIGLTWVIFRDGFNVVDDNGVGRVYNWTASSPSSSWPILYTRNSTLRALIGFYLPANEDPYWLQIRGTNSIGLLQSPTFYVLPSSAGREDYCYMNGSGCVSNCVSMYSGLTIGWQFRVRPDEETPWSSWSTFRTTTHVLYVCLGPGAPATTPLYRTLVENACKRGGATSEYSAVVNVWFTFSGLSTTTWDGYPLFYYEPGTTFGGNGWELEDLLAERTGQCKAWRNFLVRCLLVHNISSGCYQVVPGTVFDFEPDPDVFLIKQWTTETPHGYYPYNYHIEFPSFEQYEMYPPTVGDFGDLVSNTTLAGQGAETPSEKIFGCHYILKWSNLYLDPSYGKAYTSCSHMESLTVAGYGVEGYGGGADVYMLGPTLPNALVFVQDQ